MSKYDCSKVLDCVHELRRLCDGNSNKKCEDECPLHGHSCSPWSLTQIEIDILQKWSDEHPEPPEPPKLTKKDRMFLECFATGSNRTIVKDSDVNSFYHYDGVYSKLSDDMFKALEPGTRMTFEELMKLEVEE